MKKVLLIFVTVLCYVVTAVAEPVTESEAREKAAQFVLSLKGGSSPARSAQRIGGSDGISAKLTAVEVQKDFYVFNIDSDGGYVIVSGDDCVGDNLVLGYAEQGSFSTDNIPDNLKWWLNTTAEGIARLRDLGVKATSVPLHEDIPPMVTAKWDQGIPYNIFCPKYYGQQTLTGCMATALAQVMYYHRWPQAITGTLPSYTMADGCVVDALPSTTFDWDNMTDSYDDSSTDEQKNAVATLMQYCGQSMQLDYNPQGTSGLCYDLDLLANCFGYDPGVYSAKSYDYTVSGWDALLYNELSEGRPLVYSGLSTGDGHAFVIDGYKVQDGEGYFSVNWGWSGNSNGFYKINLLNPEGSDGFSRDQHALIGLQPCLDPSARYYRGLYSYRWNYPAYDGPEIAMVNQSYLPGSFDIALVNRNSDGMPDYSSIVYQDNVTVAGFSTASLLNDGMIGLYNLVLTEDVYNDMFKNLAPGNYDLMFVNREDVEGAPWQPVFGPNSYMEVVIGETGKMTKCILHPQPQLSLTASGIKVEGMKQWGISQAVTANFRNESADDYVGQVLARVYYVEDGVLTDMVFRGKTGIMIEAGGTSDINFNFSVSRVGQYALLLSKEGNEELTGTKLADITQVPYYLGHQLVTFDELNFTCLGAEYYEKYDGDKPVGVLEYIVGNGTPMDYDAKIIFKFFKRNDSGGYDPVMFQNKSYVYKDLRVSSNQCVRDCIDLPNTLEPGEYSINMYIANNFYSLFMENYFCFASVPFTISTTGVESIEHETLRSALPLGSSKNIEHYSDEWYTINGVKLNGKPTQKGMYINNGKKVFIH